MKRWPNQVRFVQEALAAIRRGRRRILVSSPTGTGKSTSVCDFIEALADETFKSVLYTNRNLLITQLEGVLDKHGIDYGVRKSGRKQSEAHWPVQISSLPTETNKVLKLNEWSIHGAGSEKCVAIVDEAHLNAGLKAREMYKRHADAGHVVLGVTATPIGIGDLYDELLVVGTLAEGREVGALMLAEQYAPDEPDWRAYKKALKSADASSLFGVSGPQARSIMGLMTPDGPDRKLDRLYGRVWDNYQLENPDGRAGILFATGIPESLFFAEQFSKKGVRAAHIDGEHIWVDGELHLSTAKLRQQILDDSESGYIKLLCNRFVLREGIDAPWLGHGIFATVFGSLSTYLQSAGRLLRFHKSLERVTLQDHGGNVFRFGSVNADREWFLDITDFSAAQLRANAIRRGHEKPPFRCPKCNRVWSSKGRTCIEKFGGCGYELRPAEKHSRMVVTTEGELRLSHAQVFTPRRVMGDPVYGMKRWERMVYRAAQPKWNATWSQAFAVFARENYHQWPDPNWPMMPLDPRQEYRPVAETALDQIRWDESRPELHDKFKGYLQRKQMEAANA